MVYRKIITYMIALASCMMIYTACGQEDYLGVEHISGSDRWMTMEPGISGMVRWLNEPVPSFPWYSSSDVDFYKQTVPPAAFSPFREYYATTIAPPTDGIVSNPVKFDIAQNVPLSIYYGVGQGLPYSQYLSITPSKTNDLWIRGPRNWTQYLVSPEGITLDLIANVPAGGRGGFYETIQTETTSSKYQTCQFYQGHNSMNYYADQIGRHMLYFVVNSQPSNVIVVDVFAQTPQAQPSVGPLPDSASVPQMPITAPSSGDTTVTISYPNPSSFQVYVDNAYVGSGAGGNFTFKVKGGMNHLISIWDGLWMYQKDIFFESGLPKIIYVEAV
jgi:hypothetical protein